MIGVSFIGDWTGVQAGLTALPQILKSSADWGNRKAAEKLVKIAKAHIDNQDLGWPALSSSSNSGDPRILVDTEDMRNSIKAWRQNYKYYAGIPMNAHNSRGIRIADIAIMHEFGYGNMPQRSLWGPSIQDLGGRKGIQKIVSDAIYNKIKFLRTKGIQVDYRL
jgi:hypothetical protein